MQRLSFATGAAQGVAVGIIAANFFCIALKSVLLPKYLAAKVAHPDAASTHWLGTANVVEEKASTYGLVINIIFHKSEKLYISFIFRDMLHLR